MKYLISVITATQSAISTQLVFVVTRQDLPKSHAVWIFNKCQQTNTISFYNRWNVRHKKGSFSKFITQYAVRMDDPVFVRILTHA